MQTFRQNVAEIVDDLIKFLTKHGVSVTVNTSYFDEYIEMQVKYLLYILDVTKEPYNSELYSQGILTTVKFLLGFTEEPYQYNQESQERPVDLETLSFDQRMYLLKFSSYLTEVKLWTLIYLENYVRFNNFSPENLYNQFIKCIEYYISSTYIDD